MKALLLLLAALPASAGVLPLAFEASRAPALSFALYPSAVDAGLPPSGMAPVPALRPLQPPIAAPVPVDAPGLARIAVVGDAGTGDAHQRAIAGAMAAERERSPFAAVLALGDNVYRHGEPAKFDGAIRDMYAALFDGGARFFPVMGNHDIRAGDGEPQRRYWGDAPRWFKKTLGDVEVFALDTTVLLPRHQQRSYKDEIPEMERLGREQLAWLDAELAKSAAKHVVVYGHHPLYVSSNEEAKAEETALLRESLEPILLKHGVKLYLSGHQHHYERSRPVDGLVHVVSGAGGGHLSRGPLSYPSGVAEKTLEERHFLVLDVGEDGIRVRALDADGKTLDDFTVLR